MTDACLRPGTVRVAVGDTVTVRNDDSYLHNLYGADGWFHGDLAPGASATHTFGAAGTYSYACTLHPGMVGAVVVGDAELVSSTQPVAGDERGGPTVGAAVLGGAAAAAAGFAGGRRLPRSRVGREPFDAGT
jgi:hypothetical protein